MESTLNTLVRNHEGGEKMAILNSDKYYKGDKIIDMFKVSQLSVPNMTIHINSGTVIRNSKIYNFEETNSDIIAVPTMGTWLVAISLDENFDIVYTYGPQSTEQKKFPTLPEECFHLALIEISRGDTEITNDKIYDLRQFMGFSPLSETACRCKCTAETVLTPEQEQLITNLEDKIIFLQTQIDELRGLHDPQKVYRVKTDSGLLYDIRFKDDGTPYFTRVGYPDDPDIPVDPTDDEKKNYRFEYDHNKINIVNQNDTQFCQLQINVKPQNHNTENIDCALVLRCTHTTIYSENYRPQYRENEFRISSIKITPQGFREVFELNFHSSGVHYLSFVLIDNETNTLLDSGEIEYDVTFANNSLLLRKLE
jgi:hypothetical protein